MSERTREIMWQVAVFAILSFMLLWGLPVDAQAPPTGAYAVRAADDGGSAEELLSSIRENIAGMKVAPRAAVFPSIRVLDVEADGMTLEVFVPRVRVLSHEVRGEGRDFVRIDGFGHTMETGWPPLPVGYFTVSIPAGRSVRAIELVETDDSVRTDLRLALIDSVFGDEAARALETGGPTGVFPGDLVQAETVRGTDGEALLGLSVYPVQWERAVDGTEIVSTYRRIRVWVAFE